MENRTKMILVSLLSGILAAGTVPVMAETTEEVAVESVNLESGDLEEDSFDVEVETVDIEAVDERVQGTCDTGHRLKFVPEKAATCKTKGNLSYYLCENCGGHFKDAEGKEAYGKNGWVISKKAHTFDAGKITTKATAAKEGARTCTCKVCKQKVKYKIPRTAFTYKLGTKSGCIVSKVSDFKSIQLPINSAYSTTKKAFALDTETWRLLPTRNAYKYYKNMKSSIPLTVTTKDGKKSTVKVKFQFPDPEVKITKTYEKQAGRGVYRYTFQYDIPGATRIQVRLNTKSSSFNQDFNRDFDKYLSKTKSDRESYIRVWKSRADSLGKNGVRFQITAYYGKNKSRTITIAK